MPLCNIVSLLLINFANSRFLSAVNDQKAIEREKITNNFFGKYVFHT